MLYRKLACHHCSQIEVVQGPQPDVEIQTLLLISQRYEHLSLAPADFPWKCWHYLKMCIFSGVQAWWKRPCVILQWIPVYTFSSHLCWALVHTVGSYYQKGTNLTNCPFGSQNTCSTCFLSLLCHLSSFSVTLPKLICVPQHCHNLSFTRKWDISGALFLVRTATWRHLGWNIRCLLCWDGFGEGWGPNWRSYGG